MKFNKLTERGQALVVIALAAVVLLGLQRWRLTAAPNSRTAVMPKMPQILPRWLAGWLWQMRRPQPFARVEPCKNGSARRSYALKTMVMTILRTMRYGCFSVTTRIVLTPLYRLSIVEHMKVTRIILR